MVVLHVNSCPSDWTILVCFSTFWILSVYLSGELKSMCCCQSTLDACSFVWLTLSTLFMNKKAEPL